MPAVLSLAGGFMLGIVAAVIWQWMRSRGHSTYGAVLPERVVPEAYCLPGQFGTAVLAGGIINICSGHFSDRPYGFGDDGTLNLLARSTTGELQRTPLKVAQGSWTRRHIVTQAPATLTGVEFEPQIRRTWPSCYIEIWPGGEQEGQRPIIAGPLDIRDPNGGGSGFPLSFGRPTARVHDNEPSTSQ
jgi:hypothetical protein